MAILDAKSEPPFVDFSDLRLIAKYVEDIDVIDRRLAEWSENLIASGYVHECYRPIFEIRAYDRAGILTGVRRLPVGCATCRGLQWLREARKRGLIPDNGPFSISP